MFYLRSCKFHSKFQTHLSITIEENPSPRRYNKKKPPDEKHKNCKVVKLYDTALHQLSYTLKHIGRQENMLFLCESSYVQSEMWLLTTVPRLFFCRMLHIPRLQDYTVHIYNNTDFENPTFLCKSRYVWYVWCQIWLLYTGPDLLQVNCIYQHYNCVTQILRTAILHHLHAILHHLHVTRFYIPLYKYKSERC